MRKKHEHSILWLKQYCSTIVFVCIFSNLFISGNTRESSWLDREIPWFYSIKTRFIRRAECFSLFNTFANPLTHRTRKSFKTTKCSRFSIFLLFFNLFEVFTLSAQILSVSFQSFWWSRTSKFSKIHDFETGS